MTDKKATERDHCECRPDPTLILAPLRGVTDALLRDCFNRNFGGLDRAVAPFLTQTGRGGPRPAEIRRAARAQFAELPAVPQLLSSTAEDFIPTAKRLADSGCTEVNWNLGCPHPPVVRRKRGAGLLPYPEKIASFLDVVVPTIPMALSVKIRLGRDHPDESLRVLEVLDQYPLVEVTIHARLATQMYKGVVDLESFQRCIEMTHHRLVYNGDIVDVEGFRALEARFPSINHWMLGRGALADPSLPSRIKGLELEDVMGRLRRLHGELYAEAKERLSGPSHVLSRMKGIWTYLGWATVAETKLLKKLKKVQSLGRYEELVDRILSSEKPSSTSNRNSVTGYM